MKNKLHNPLSFTSWSSNLLHLLLSLLIFCQISACGGKKARARAQNQVENGKVDNLNTKLPTEKEFTPLEKTEILSICQALAAYGDSLLKSDLSDRYTLQIEETNCDGSVAKNEVAGLIKKQETFYSYDLALSNTFISTVVDKNSIGLKNFCRQIEIDRDATVQNTYLADDDEKIMLSIPTSNFYSLDSDVKYLDILHAVKGKTNEYFTWKKKHLAILSSNRGPIKAGSVIEKRIMMSCFASGADQIQSSTWRHRRALPAKASPTTGMRITSVKLLKVEVKNP
jgi:hypothetical protein